MTLDEFNKLSDSLLNKAKEIRDSKRKSYAPGDDVLSNFKEDGKAAGIKSLQAWLLHYSKQMAAVRSFIIHGHISEPMDQRFADLINYTLLGWALINDRPMFEIGEQLND